MWENTCVWALSCAVKYAKTPLSWVTKTPSSCVSLMGGTEGGNRMRSTRAPPSPPCRALQGMHLQAANCDTCQVLGVIFQQSCIFLGEMAAVKGGVLYLRG